AHRHGVRRTGDLRDFHLDRQSRRWRAGPLVPRRSQTRRRRYNRIRPRAGAGFGGFHRVHLRTAGGDGAGVGHADDRRAMRLIVELLRAAAALLVAPAVAATLFVGFEWISNPGWPGIDPGDVTFLWPVAFIVALAHAVMLGLPAYLLLRWMRLTRWWVSLAGGFAIGALPYAIYFSPLREISSHSEVGR